MVDGTLSRVFYISPQSKQKLWRKRRSKLAKIAMIGRLSYPLFYLILSHYTEFEKLKTTLDIVPFSQCFSHMEKKEISFPVVQEPC